VDEPADNLKLNDRQKTRLLGLGLEPEQPITIPNGDEQRGDLLCDILRHPLPPNDQVQAKAIERSWVWSRLIAGPPLWELLLDPGTEVAVLRRIKEYAKEMGQKAKSEVERDALLAVYFAAIAAARLSHSQQITEHSDHDIREFLRVFATSSWVPQRFCDLFARASRA
jgi:hypothetical protein